MNDDELRAQLERRSAAAPIRAEDLLPGVSRATGAVVRGRPARFARWAPLAGLAAAALVVFALVVVIPRTPLGGASSAPPTTPASSPNSSPSAPPPASNVAVVGKTQSGDFKLTIRSPKSVYAAGEALQIDGSLEYTGPQASVPIRGSGSLVSYGIKQVDGALGTEPVFPADCAPYTISPSEPIAAPYQLSGGFTNDDPNASFYQSLFADQLHLPAGRWQIFADTSFDAGTECTAHPIHLRASIDIEVLPGDPQQSSPSMPETSVPTADPSPSSNAVSCGPFNLADMTGLVTWCAPGGKYLHVDGVLAVSYSIIATWTTSTCASVLDASFAPSGDGYVLAIREVVRDSMDCQNNDATATLNLQLDSPLTGKVRAVVDGRELPSIPWSSEPPTQVSVDHDCGPTMVLTDTTGQVVGCSDAGIRDYHTQEPHVSVDPVDPHLLHIWWIGSYCPQTFALRVAVAPTNLPKPADFVVDVSTNLDGACEFPSPEGHAADIQFGSQVDARRIQLVDGSRIRDPVPCVAELGLANDGDGVDIYDETDLITSCIQRQSTVEPTGSATNASDASIVVAWTDRPCGVPIHLSFAANANGYALDEPGHCMASPAMAYEIEVSFVKPISAESVDTSTLGTP